MVRYYGAGDGAGDGDGDGDVTCVEVCVSSREAFDAYSIYSRRSSWYLILSISGCKLVSVVIFNPMS